MNSMILRTLSITATALLLAFAQPALAKEAQPTAAVAKEKVEAASEKANTQASAAKDAAEDGDAKPEDKATGEKAAKNAEADAKTDEAAAEDEEPARELTPEEKDAAMAEADAITAYDAEKVRGMAKPWQHTYQPASSPVMKRVVGLHNGIFVVITIITIIVTALLVYVCVKFRAAKNPVPNRFAHNTFVEIAWTVIPILILIGIGIPSVRAHYFTNSEDTIAKADMTLKVVGHQWYWSYEYPEHGIAFDSNIVPENELKDGEPRLLTVDNPLVVPVGKVVRVQLTSADVIHDWAMPAFAIKQDTVPGKLSETWFKAEEEGIYYGQCSELCGKYHGFMPIEIHVVSEEMFDAWVAGAKLKFAQNDNFQLAALSR